MFSVLSKTRNVRYRTNIVQYSALLKDPVTEIEIRQEINRLTHLQKEAIELAIFVGMTTFEAAEYDKRRLAVTKLVGQLAILIGSQRR